MPTPKEDEFDELIQRTQDLTERAKMLAEETERLMKRIEEMHKAQPRKK